MSRYKSITILLQFKTFFLRKKNLFPRLNILSRHWELRSTCPNDSSKNRNRATKYPGPTCIAQCKGGRLHFFILCMKTSFTSFNRKGLFLIPRLALFSWFIFFFKLFMHQRTSYRPCMKEVTTVPGIWGYRYIHVMESPHISFDVIWFFIF